MAVFIGARTMVWEERMLAWSFSARTTEKLPLSCAPSGVTATFAR